MKTVKQNTSLGITIWLFLCTLTAPAALAGDITVDSLSASYQSALSMLKVECAMTVPEPWHINSRQPSQEYLIPTRIRLMDTAAVQPAKHDYPKAGQMTFFGQEMAVYQGALRIKEYYYLSKKAAFPLEGILQYQACDDKMCYPPVKKPFRLIKNKNESIDVVLIKTEQ
jgi:hypothetical protein